MSSVPVPAGTVNVAYSNQLMEHLNSMTRCCNPPHLLAKHHLHYPQLPVRTISQAVSIGQRRDFT
jgi:hypothetical protein